jgi:uncharacterized protein
MVNNESYRITADLFTIPYQENFIIYAPRVGFACVINKALVNLLADLARVDISMLNQEQKGALDYLCQKGVLNGSDELNCIKVFPEKYMPVQVTLFPTNQCNLKCKYCYASAGEFKPMTMDWHYATSAIEQVIKNMKEKGLTYFSLGFHGGGEPLYPWQFIQRIVTYTEERCAKEGFQLAVFSATNGVLSEKQLEWIVQHFVNLNISFDGLPHIQDMHRPFENGKSSFEFVDRTMRYLDEKGFNYGIRSTISAYNVDLMQESVDYIGQNYKTKTVHFEPLFYCGRCKTDGDLKPEIQKFATNFQLCEKECQNYNFAFTYSGCRIENLSSSFCGVSMDNFSVTPDGYITTCYEVTTQDDPKAETFFIGRIGADGELIIDEKKRRFLHSLTVDKLDFCKDCFAKWHCAGECAAKLGHTDYTGARGHDRCELNRQLVKNRLISLIEGSYHHPAMKCYGEKTSGDC